MGGGDVCVIGGGGFIGTRLASRMLKNRAHDFVLVDKIVSSDYPIFSKIGDVRDLDSLRASIPPNSSVIVNLAAEHQDNVSPKSLYYDVNVQGATNVCAIAREYGINNIVFTSTVAVYGFPAPGALESTAYAPFNDYGRSKMEAECEYMRWQSELPSERSLTIIRPTVVFGERNRGNVYNLLNAIALRRFLMIGDGLNRKSLAYVENICAFLQHMFSAGPGIHIYNYVDKPDLTMAELVHIARDKLSIGGRKVVSIPFWLGYCGGLFLDIISMLTGRKFSISAIRVKKFCATTSFGTSVDLAGFSAPVTLEEGLHRTIDYEFLDGKQAVAVFYSE